MSFSLLSKYQTNNE